MNTIEQLKARAVKSHKDHVDFIEAINALNIREKILIGDSVEAAVIVEHVSKFDAIPYEFTEAAVMLGDAIRETNNAIAELREKYG